MNITNEKILSLVEKFKKLQVLTGVKFSYAINKNFEKLKQEANLIYKTVEPYEEFLPVIEKIRKIQGKYSKKENGKDVIKNNEYVIDESKRQEYEAELKKIEEDNKEVWDKRQQQLDNFNKFLKEKSTFEPYKIKIKDIPENITVEQMGVIKDFVDDTEEE